MGTRQIFNNCDARGHGTEVTNIEYDADTIINKHIADFDKMRNQWIRPIQAQSTESVDPEW